MFNPAIFENSLPGGGAVLQVVDPSVPGDGTQQRFVPLKSTMLSGEIDGPLAALQVQQTFAFTHEQSAKPIEALYRFPLPGDAAVTGVRVRFGDVTIETQLSDRSEAETAYKQAKDVGQQAALLSREAPDVFTLQVAGIAPGEDVIFTTAYVQLARLDEGAWTLRVPLTAAPRYVRGDELGSAHANGQPLSLLRDPGHRFSVALRFHRAASVFSNTHELAIENEEGIQHVRLAGGTVLPDRDCVLSWRPSHAEKQPALSLFAHADDDGFIYFLALLTPPSKAAVEPHLAREVILLVDHSGSMAGPKWAAADWAVERFLSDLHPDDAFGLCLFHDSTNWYRRELTEASPSEVEDAVSWLGKRRDSGGTNLGVALEEALAMPPAGGQRTRAVLLFTDAQVTDDGRILRLVDAEAAKPVERGRRVSVLCIDAAPNAYLANQVAECGGGIARFLTSEPSEGDITTALDRVLATWSQPVLANLRLAADGASIQPSGRRTVEMDGVTAIDFGDLPTGSPLWAAGRVPRGDADSLELTVKTAGGQAVAQAAIGLAGDLAIEHESPHVKALFGARRINELEHLVHADLDGDALAEQLQRLGYAMTDILPLPAKPVYAESRRKANEQALRDLLLRESLAFGLPSSVASFVAVRQEAGEPVESSVIVANALPAGWSQEFLPGVAPTAAGQALQAVKSALLPGMGPPNMPVAAGMPMPMPAMMPGPSAQPPPTSAQPRPHAWMTIFEGELAGAETVLYDSDASPIQPSGATTIRGIRFENGKDADRPQVVAGSASIAIFVGDMAAPRAKMRLADLIRFSERPLNLLLAAGERILIVLNDPEGALTGQMETLAISVRW